MSKVKMHHLLVLDSSGSMSEVKGETIEGFNQQIHTIQQNQKDNADEQEHFISLVVFGADSENQIDYKIWKEPCDDVEPLNSQNYLPFGRTPLFDAIGMGIQGLKNEIREDLEEDSTRVSVAIFTDGRENASREHTATSVSEMIEQIRDTRKWLVTFIGCEENVFEVAESMGISRDNTMSYARGKAGTTQAFARMSSTYTKMSNSVKLGTFDHLVVEGVYGADKDVSAAQQISDQSDNKQEEESHD